jgi:hypothetical protein
MFEASTATLEVSIPRNCGLVALVYSLCTEADLPVRQLARILCTRNWMQAEWACPEEKSPKLRRRRVAVCLKEENRFGGCRAMEPIAGRSWGRHRASGDGLGGLYGRHQRTAWMAGSLPPPGSGGHVSTTTARSKVGLIASRHKPMSCDDIFGLIDMRNPVQDDGFSEPA